MPRTDRPESPAPIVTFTLTSATGTPLGPPRTLHIPDNWTMSTLVAWTAATMARPETRTPFVHELRTQPHLPACPEYHTDDAPTRWQTTRLDRPTIMVGQVACLVSQIDQARIVAFTHRDGTLAAVLWLPRTYGTPRCNGRALFDSELLHDMTALVRTITTVIPDAPFRLDTPMVPAGPARLARLVTTPRPDCT